MYRRYGQDLIARLRQQLTDLKTEFVVGDARIKKNKTVFEVRVGQKLFRARTAIIATGMVDEEPPIKNSEKLCLENVTAYCPVCDGYEYCDQPIGILVKDAHGIRKIRFIASFSPDIKLIVIGETKIAAKHRRILEEVGGEIHKGKLEDIVAAKNPKGAMVYLKAQPPIHVRALYIALGARVRDEAFSNMRLKRTREGYLRVNSHQETSTKDLFAVGDCVNDLSQISVAAGHAAVAATAIHSSLLHNEKVWKTLSKSRES